MKTAVIYIHGLGGNAGEAGHFAPLFPGDDVIGFDYKAAAPWEAQTEFTAYFSALRSRYGLVRVIANSIGAFFIMNAEGAVAEEAFFISPVTDMERLIRDMMAKAGVTEAELREKKAIPLPDGTVLSWKYLCYVRRHPLRWTVPTHILVGENDALIPRATVAAFAERTGASLDVMPGGEHWFHTPEQMLFLDEWLRGLRSQREAP